MEFENNNGSQSGQLLSSPNPRCSSHKRKAGRKKFRETRHPVYRGVRQRNGNKWVCEIREPKNKSRIWVRTYLTPEMAARAHDVAVLALSGTSASAKFNFPESVSLLPLPNSSSATDIRAAAAKATSHSSKPYNNLTFSSSHNGNAHQCPCFNNLSMLGLEGIRDCNDDHSQTMFFDEEALYNMPALLDSMAEGLLLTPPSIKTEMDWDDVASQIDLTLWTN